MKAFHFRLDQALRWRSTQVDIEKANVAAAASQVTALRASAENRRAELKSEAERLTTGSTGSALETWGAWQSRTHRQIRDLEKQILEAEKTLAARMHQLAEANRKMRLLEKLKEKHRARWRSEFDRELETFAAEAFLLTLQSKNERARSSGG